MIYEGDKSKKKIPSLFIGLKNNEEMITNSSKLLLAHPHGLLFQR